MAAKKTKSEAMFLSHLNARLNVTRSSIRLAKTLEQKFICKGRLEELLEIKAFFIDAINNRIKESPNER